MTFNGDEGLKHNQVLRYGSEEWAETYNRDRNISEGYNSYIKDISHEAFEAPGGRRMRGLAAQQFLATFLVVSANLRAIYTFIRDRYLAEAYGVTKNRPVHVSEYARQWFIKPEDTPADPPGRPLRT